MELYGLKDKDGKEYKLIVPKENEVIGFVRAIEITPEPGFKVGDWVYINNAGSDVSVYRITSIDNDSNSPINFDGGGAWGLDNIRHATKEEIETHLRKIADEKYPIGTKYIHIHNGSTQQVKLRLNYLMGNDLLTDGCGGSVYFQGKWAEIVSEKKKLPKTLAEHGVFLGEFAKFKEEYRGKGIPEEEFLNQYED